MENSPLKTEDDSDKKESTKKKKSAGALGAILVEPKSRRLESESADEDSPKESLWQQFIKRPEKPGPLSVSGTAEMDLAAHEVSEAEAPLEELSPAEKEFVIREIAKARAEGIEIPETYSGDSVEAQAMEAEAAAARAYYDGILRGDQAEAGPDAEESSDGVSKETDFSSWWLPKSGEGEHTAPTIPTPEASSKEAEDDRGPDAPFTGGSSSPPPNYRPPHAAGSGNFQPPVPPLPTAEARPFNHATDTARQESDEPRYTRANVVGAALIGGIIGYLVGRRRGRIKTEKQLLPVQKKMEKQVEELEHDIIAKETKIRKAAREQTYQYRELYKLKKEKAGQPDQQRAPAPEANQLHGKKLRHEQIGHVLMAAERPAARQPEKTKDKIPAPDRHVEIMSRDELMSLSEAVAINNTTLRRIYDSHMIGEHGLRRLVNEHMRGGDIQRVLRQEMLEHETDFERDPILRDRSRQKTDSQSQDGSVLNNLLEKVGVTGQGDSEERAVLQAREAHDTAARGKAQRGRRLVDVSLISVIAVLAAIILVLIMNNR